MTKQDQVRCINCALASYVVVGLLMFGWSINHTECDIWPSGTVDCSERNVGAVFCGAAWPMCIGGRIAIAITDWP